MKTLRDLRLQQADQQFQETTIPAGNQQQDLLLVKLVTLRQTEQRQDSKAILLPELQAQRETLATEVEEDKIKLSFGWLDALLKV